MKVTALNEAQVIRMKKANDQGVTYVQLSRRFGVDRKTCSRAIKLYEEIGAMCFEPEKVPQRGKRYHHRDIQNEESFKYQNLLSQRWDKLITL